MKFGDKLRKLVNKQGEEYEIIVNSMTEFSIKVIEGKLESKAALSTDTDFLVNVDEIVTSALLQKGTDILEGVAIKKEIFDRIQTYFENERLEVVRNPTYARWEWLFKC